MPPKNTTTPWPRKPDFFFFPVDQIDEFIGDHTAGYLILLRKSEIEEVVILARYTDDIAAECASQLVMPPGSWARPTHAAVEILPARDRIDKNELIGRKLRELRLNQEFSPLIQLS